MPIKFLKSDFWRAFIAGEGIALLSLPIFKNLKIFNSTLIFIWIIFLPFVAALGLYLVYRLTIQRWSAAFQVAKYGIIGLLNTFLAAAILNFFILITGIAKGLWVDVFVFVAFCGGVTNSFFWNKFWTFRANNTGKAKKEYVKFFAVTGAVSLLNVFLMHILINTIGAPQGIDPKVWANIAFFVLIPISFLGNFFGYKIFVFRKP